MFFLYMTCRGRWLICSKKLKLYMRCIDGQLKHIARLHLHVISLTVCTHFQFFPYITCWGRWLICSKKLKLSGDQLSTYVWTQTGSALELALILCFCAAMASVLDFNDRYCLLASFCPGSAPVRCHRVTGTPQWGSADVYMFSTSFVLSVVCCQYLFVSSTCRLWQPSTTCPLCALKP